VFVIRACDFAFLKILQKKGLAGFVPFLSQVVQNQAAHRVVLILNEMEEFFNAGGTPTQ
jgi:hypothetical protein